MRIGDVLDTPRTAVQPKFAVNDGRKLVRRHSADELPESAKGTANCCDYIAWWVSIRTTALSISVSHDTEHVLALKKKKVSARPGQAPWNQPGDACKAIFGLEN